MSSVDTILEPAAVRGRYFVRFGDVPIDNKSRMWTAPNAYMHSKIGQILPGLSAYPAKLNGDKWVLNTEEINVGSGIASLLDFFASSVDAPDANKIYLLKGVATTWRNLTPQEQDQFADWYPGEHGEGYDMLGTDGEPLVRDFEIVSTLKVSDLICEMIAFPEDWDEEQVQSEEPDASELCERNILPGQSF